MFSHLKKAFISFLFVILINTTVANANEIYFNQIKKILIVVAMENEAQPIIANLKLKKITPTYSANLPMKFYRGNLGKLKIALITNGKDPMYGVENVGTQAATLTTYLGVASFHPDLIISIGTAGGVEKNHAKLKTIYVSKKIYFFDRRLPTKNYHAYGKGGYPSAVFSDINQKLELPLGVICSGDSFDENQTDYSQFLQEQCTAVDMEAAGVAWVSMLVKTPMLAMKGITNFVKGKNVHQQYHKNLSSMTLALANKLKGFLEILANKL